MSDSTWPFFALTDPLVVATAHRNAMKLWGVPDDKPVSYNPSPNPVSYVPAHLPQLKEPGRYVVGEKTDGERCMLVLTRTDDGRPVNVVFDRGGGVFTVSVAAHRAWYAGLGSVFDGELVKSRLTDRWIYVVFDVVGVKGTSLVDTPGYADRMAAATASVASPSDATSPAAAKAAAKAGKWVWMPSGPDKASVDVRVKTLWPVVDAGAALKGCDDYRSDGLIFMPAHEPIRLACHPTMIKAKPLEENTIELRLEVQRSGGVRARAVLELMYSRAGKEFDICGDKFYFFGYALDVSLADSPALHAAIETAQASSDTHKPCIVECHAALDVGKETLRLTVVKTRNKDASNSHQTISRTLETIYHGVGCAELVGLLKGKRTR